MAPKQQNATNRERAAEQNPWGGGDRPEGAAPPSAGSNAGEFAEGASSAEASADPNYMYSSGTAHNGSAPAAGSGEGY